MKDNPERARERAREWYHNNKQKRYEYNRSSKVKKARERKREYVNSRKSSCLVCGWFLDPCGIDFHHLDPNEKTERISKIIGLSQSKIDAEIDKCVCLCACCHRLVHQGVIDLEDHLRR